MNPEKLWIGQAGGKTLRVPANVQTQTIAVLGIRGSGKTNTAVVIAEELLERGRPVVILDPTDVWWGLRSSADGKRPGRPIVVLGGPHGQIPLATGDGALLADFCVEEQASAVLSLRHLRKTDQRRFVTDFAEQLYHRKGETPHRTPLQVVIDECDAFVPQRVGGAEARMVGAIEDLVRRGRAAGLGIVLISQRAASVNKDVLAQLELLVAHRHVSPQDRKALDAWVEAHDAHGRRDEFMASLAGLPIGTAWFWSPGWLDIFCKVAVRARATFDSSATPKSGPAPRVPTAVAEVDLEKLRGRLAQTVAQQEASDPTRLRRRVAELEAALAAASAQVRTQTVETPVLRPGEFEGLKNAVQAVEQAADHLRLTAEGIKTAVGAVHWGRQTLAPAAVARPNPEPDARTAAKPDRVAKAYPNGIGAGGCRRMLDVLVSRDPARFTEAQWATLSGLRRTGGTWATYKSRLLSAGLVRPDGGGLWQATPAAVAQYGGAVQAPRTAAEVREDWKSKLGRGPGRMLDSLLDVYPRGLSRDGLAERCGLTSGAGTFSTYLSRLRSNGLVKDDNGLVTLSEELVG